MVVRNQLSSLGGSTLYGLAISRPRLAIEKSHGVRIIHDHIRSPNPKKSQSLPWVDWKETYPDANHGAGRFNYATWCFSCKCWDEYSSTMEHVSFSLFQSKSRPKKRIREKIRTSGIQYVLFFFFGTLVETPIKRLKRHIFTLGYYIGI